MKDHPHADLVAELKRAKAADADRAAGRFTNYTAEATAALTHELFHRGRKAATAHTEALRYYGKEDARKIAHAILAATN